MMIIIQFGYDVRGAQPGLADQIITMIMKIYVVCVGVADCFADDDDVDDCIGHAG